jgi:uncharacterized protein (TIGR02265 family)
MDFSGAQADLERRRRIAEGEQAVRGVLAQQVFEVLEERVGREVAQSCRPTLRGKDGFAEVRVLEFLDLLGDALLLLERTGLSPERFYEEIGRRAVFAIRDATIGRTFASMAAGDPLRLFERLGSGPSVLIAFGQRRVVEAAPGRVRIAFPGSILPPRIFAGMYCAMALGVGATTASATSAEPVLGDSEHVVTWG